jgi:hypothetical protein
MPCSEDLRNSTISSYCRSVKLVAVFHENQESVEMFAIKVSSRSVGLAASAFLFMSLPSVTFADDPPYEQVFSNKSATGGNPPVFGGGSA